MPRLAVHHPRPRRPDRRLAAFGANYVFTKQILEAGPPARAWMFFRIAAATVFLVPLALALGRGRLPWRRVPMLVVASFLGVVLNQVLFTEGMALTTAEHAAVINACIPTWTLLVACSAAKNG